jgi:hypothetical protein
MIQQIYSLIYNPSYQLDRRLGGPQNRSRRGSKKINSWSCRESNSGRQAHSQSFYWLRYSGSSDGCKLTEICSSITIRLWNDGVGVFPLPARCILPRFSRYPYLDVRYSMWLSIFQVLPESPYVCHHEWMCDVSGPSYTAILQLIHFPSLLAFQSYW